MPLRFAAVVAAVVASYVAFAAPAVADVSEADSRFLTTLKSLGWTIYNPDGLTTEAHMVCNEGLGHGVSWQEMHSHLTDTDGYSPVDASTLITTAIRVYCPQYSEIIDDISPTATSGRAGGGGSGSPIQATGPDGEFLNQLSAKGIKIGSDISAERAISIGRQQCSMLAAAIPDETLTARIISTNSDITQGMVVAAAVTGWQVYCPTLRATDPWSPPAAQRGGY